MAWSYAVRPAKPPTLSDGEQTALLCAVSEAAGAVCPIVMGIGGSDTRAAIEKVVRCNHQKIAGFLISPPSYVRPSQQGILLHFQEIAKVADHPIILYDIPARTGVDLALSTVMSLAADPHFVAIKQGGALSHITDLINQTSLKVLCSDDAAIFTMLCLGGHGAITAAAHIRPDLYLQVFALVQAGRTAQARTLFNGLLPLIRLLFSEPNPGPVKAALALQGHIRQELRLPMTTMSDIGRQRLASVMEQVMALPQRRPLPPGQGSENPAAFRLHAGTAGNQ